MQINSPLCITSRLLPGVKIGGAQISIEYMPGYFGTTLDGRQVYRWFVDLDNCEGATAQNLVSGVGGGTLQEGLRLLLCSLETFAEAWQYLKSDPESLKPENCSLFPAELAEWAVENADEIAMLKLNLSEHPDQLIVE